MKLFVRTSAFFAAVLIATGTIAGVGQANAQTNPLESQIRAILDANPEIVVNALNKHQANQQRMQADQLAASARPVAEALIKGDAEVATVGNPAGKPIIEFFDYNCGFCKRFHSETATPLLAAGDVKMILVHTPILGPGSERLAEFAAAANLQGKFEGAHHFLIQHNARDVAEADKLIPELVTAAGLDRAKFDRSLNDGAAKRQVEHNTRLSMTAGVAGTPMIYVNNQALPGAGPLAEIQRLLN